MWSFRKSKKTKSGYSPSFCPDGANHKKQYFECDPGSWRCIRCDATYATTGLFDKELFPGSLKKIAEFKNKPLKGLLEWAVERKEAEVKHRPDENAHKRVLSETWDQVIQKIEQVYNQSINRTR